MGHTGGMLGFFMGGNMGNINSRKNRVIELRTRIRMDSDGLGDNIESRTKMKIKNLGLNENDNFQEYYRIREEEEKKYIKIKVEEENRFNERFKKKK